MNDETPESEHLSAWVREELSMLAELRQTFRGVNTELQERQGDFEKAVAALTATLVAGDALLTELGCAPTLSHLGELVVMHARETHHLHDEHYFPAGITSKQLETMMDAAFAEGVPALLESAFPNPWDNQALQAAYRTLDADQAKMRRIAAYSQATAQVTEAQRVAASAILRVKQRVLFDKLLTALRASSSENSDLRVLVDQLMADFLRHADKLPTC